MSDTDGQREREDQLKPQNHPEREDHPEREHYLERENQPKQENYPERNTEVNEAINFEWTPELVKIATSRGTIHPSIGPLELYSGFPKCEYRPGMTLPDPADTRECLRWAGLSDKKISEVEQKFNELHPDYKGPSCGYDEKFQYHAHAYNEITFPKIEEMLHMFIQGMHEDLDEVEESHKAYIEKGIQLGLRPEFAIFCGVHKDDSRAIENPYLFERDWFWMSPASIMTDTLIPLWMNLKEFMATKLLYEGKAWSGYGRWLVHDGETIDQAKARVDDRELQRLKEQAIKENEEKLECSKERKAKEHEEDLAKWAEEDRQEA
ncbi:hypothetical protein PENFLA_c010G06839 [Penicillium flavigenum]|uniref:Uncharacterized protein n=1 Tax=Penicillium flavigenum TaxID=254877 RepID=A0A1V6TDJ4_9EURO|nr:hypothetical protein PENFLA_c010G06839 [Penicillium flavigenum]